jgi:hypothetical protein
MGALICSLLARPLPCQVRFVMSCHALAVVLLLARMWPGWWCSCACHAGR